MELRDYLDILRRRWVSVTAITLAVLALAAAATLAMTPTYTGTTRLFFAVEGGESVTDLAQGSTFAEKQMTSYAEVATSPLVLDPVIRELDLDTTAARLARTVSATIPPETVILEVAATDPDPKRAAAVANAIGEEVSTVAADLSPERSDGSQAVRATTLAPALVPSTPSSPNLPRNLALGLVLGLLLGLGAALLRHVLDTKIRNEAAVREVSDSSVLGVIAFDAKVPNHPVILRDEPMSAPAEAVRRLRTNLQFIDVAERPRSIVVSSSIPGEGKSTTAVNLAVALADSGSKVILVDADLRRPSVATSMGLEGGVGLTTVLIGRAELDDVIQPWESGSLDILPAGQVPPNPSELLGSLAMEKLLAQLTERYDLVLLDSPPLLPVTDAVVLSKLAGGALVVVGADRVHRAQLQESLSALDIAGVHIFGLVVNKVDRKETRPYAYHGSYVSRKEPVLAADSPAITPSAGRPRVGARSVGRAAEPVPRREPV